MNKSIETLRTGKSDAVISAAKKMGRTVVDLPLREGPTKTDWK